LTQYFHTLVEIPRHTFIKAAERYGGDKHEEDDEELSFISNVKTPTEEIAELYKQCWKIELFFK